MGQNNDNSGVIVGVVLIVILLAILFGTAWGQSLRSGMGLGDGAIATSTRVNTNDSMGDNNNNTNNTPTNTTITNTTSTTTVNSTTNADDVAFTVPVGSLSSEQQAMLKTAGVTGTEIEITNGMKTCAEQSIGAGRTAEIAGGAKPSLVESGKLIVCYNR